MKITKNRRAICKDGFSLSVQADSMTYCSPRVDNADEYTAVEVGFPSAHEPLLAPYQDGEGAMTQSVFAWVPASVIALVLIKHGGMVEGELPAGIPDYTMPDSH